MKGIIITIGILASIFLLFIGARYFTPDDRSDKVKIVHKVTGKTAKEIYEKLDLRCVGTGGTMMYDVKILQMAFQSRDHFNVEQARKLIVPCIQIYLKNVNESNKIRQYLANYPFESKNIKISIYSPHKEKGDDHLAYVTIRSGNICYEKDVGRDKQTKTILEESYEESLNILNSQKLN